MSHTAQVALALLAAGTMLPCAACSQNWTFAHTAGSAAKLDGAEPSPQAAADITQLPYGSDTAEPSPQRPAATAGAEQPRYAGGQSAYAAGQSSFDPRQPQSAVVPAGYRDPDPPQSEAPGADQVSHPPMTQDPSPVDGVTFQALSSAPNETPTDGLGAGPVFQQPGAPAFDALPPAEPATTYEPPYGTSRLSAFWGKTLHDIGSDYRHYYSWTGMRDLGIGIAVAAPIANVRFGNGETIDDQVHNWYQQNVRTSSTDRFAAFWKNFGEGGTVIPVFVGLTVVGEYFEDRPLLGEVGDYGDRVCRAYIVGAPPMLAMQWILGAGRPAWHDYGSQWHPFTDTNSVSGHAFISSVPFITAAKMVDNPVAKGTLYALSTFTAWSRVNDDAHYLSQACLGWWMGYLACRAVDGTEEEDHQLSFTPIVTPEMAGVGMVIRR